MVKLMMDYKDRREMQGQERQLYQAHRDQEGQSETGNTEDLQGNIEGKNY